MMPLVLHLVRTERTVTIWKLVSVVEDWIDGQDLTVETSCEGQERW